MNGYLCGSRLFLISVRWRFYPTPTPLLTPRKMRENPSSVKLLVVFETIEETATQPYLGKGLRRPVF